MDELLGNPNMVARRVQNMLEQEFLVARLMPNLSHRKRTFGDRVLGMREWLARKIAPWLLQ